MIYRKHVRHESLKNFQLDLFTPDDGHFEYYAVATNMTLGLPALFAFVCGRGAQEKTLAELKGEFALVSCRPTTTAPTAPGSSSACSLTTCSATSSWPPEPNRRPARASGPTRTCCRASEPSASWSSPVPAG